MEAALNNIAEKQGTNVNQLVDLVNENEEILTAMKGKLKQTFVQTMLALVMRSDGACVASGRAPARAPRARVPSRLSRPRSPPRGRPVPPSPRWVPPPQTTAT